MELPGQVEISPTFECLCFCDFNEAEMMTVSLVFLQEHLWNAYCRPGTVAGAEIVKKRSDEGSQLPRDAPYMFTPDDDTACPVQADAGGMATQN